MLVYQRVISPVWLKHFGIPSLKLAQQKPLKLARALPPPKETIKYVFQPLLGLDANMCNFCCSFQGVYTVG